jgi:CheY-like chemotaxis protein
VGVESQPGEGSTFYLTVPLAEEGSAPTVPESVLDKSGSTVAAETELTVPFSSTVAQRAPEREPLTPLRYTVLVVEDDPDIARLICGHLEKAGYVVEQADGAEQALARVAEQPPDLIILDVELPEMKGLKLAHRLAESHATRNTPILVVNVLNDDPQRPQFGVSALPKPVDRQQLLQMVAQVVLDQGRQRVLVIEDDPDTQELLGVALQERGFEVALAKDGATGLAMAWEQQPGLILLDLRLPGMDGFSVLQALKQEPATAAIPVITMTASEGLNAGTRAKVLALGASDFLTKPFDLDMLMQEISIFVQEKE